VPFGTEMDRPSMVSVTFSMTRRSYFTRPRRFAPSAGLRALRHSAGAAFAAQAELGFQ
jgi:hypothetical protein